VTREPVRTCIVCRAARPKSALVRLARVAGAQVVADPRHARGGRGAYVCGTEACLRGLARANLARAFRAPCVVKTDVVEEVTRQWRHEPR
jgi:predicted RNA-binding protein YlxR (DUF448 family)